MNSIGFNPDSNYYFSLKGGKYVYEEKAKINSKLLRALKFKVRKNNLIANESKFQNAYKVLSEHKSSHFSYSLLYSTFLHLGILVPEFRIIQIPKWIKNILKDGGLRKISQQYSDSIDSQFEYLGLKKFSHLCRSYVFCPYLSYALGQFELAQTLSSENDSSLRTRIRIQNLGHEDDDFINQMISEKSYDLENYAINSYLMLKLYRMNDNRYQQLRYKIEREDLKNKIYTNSDLLIYIQIQNCLNYSYYRDNSDAVTKNFRNIQYYISKATAYQRSLLANLRYQQSLHSLSCKNTKSAYDFLIEATNIEIDFHDAFYRLASLTHDFSNFEESLIHYEKALIFSPLNINLINDYGICLQEMDSRQEVLELENILMNLNITCQEVQNEN